MKYALLVYSDQSTWDGISEEEGAARRAESMPRWLALFEEMGRADPDCSGKELVAATEAKVVNPPRRSVWEDAKFQERIGRMEGYRETFESVIDHSTIKFTPQPEFFNITTEWAAALQDIDDVVVGKHRLRRFLSNDQTDPVANGFCRVAVAAP